MEQPKENQKISLDTKIEDLKLLSARIKTSCRFNGINTLQELLNTEYFEIKHMRNMGEGSLRELKDYIHHLGFTLLNEELSISETREEKKKKGLILLEDYDFSSKIFLTLYRNNIYTMEELIAYGTKVYSLKGFGLDRQQELREKLMELNIKLENMVQQEVLQLVEQWKAGMITKENLLETFCSIEITDLTLSNRIKKYLVRNAIKTLGELLAIDYKDIKNIVNLGEVSLRELIDYIHSLGFTLLNEEPLISDKIKELKERGVHLLEDYDLSSLVCSPMYQNDIYTMEDVLAKGEEIFYVKGFSPKGKKELLGKMLILGLEANLKEVTDIEKSHSLDTISSKKKIDAVSKHSLEYTPNLEIVELGFPEKIHHILTSHGIITIENLVNYGPAVYQLKGLNLEDAVMIKDKLREWNIEFSIEDENVEQLPWSSSYTEVLQDIKKETELIKIRCQKKEQLLKEYNMLMQERTELLAKEVELDRKIEELSQQLQEEVKGQRHVKRK